MPATNTDKKIKMKKRGRKSKETGPLRNFRFCKRVDYVLNALTEKRGGNMTEVIEQLIKKEGEAEKIEYPAQVV